MWGWHAALYTLPVTSGHWRAWDGDVLGKNRSVGREFESRPTTKNSESHGSPWLFSQLRD